MSKFIKNTFIWTPKKPTKKTSFMPDQYEKVRITIEQLKGGE